MTGNSSPSQNTLPSLENFGLLTEPEFHTVMVNKKRRGIRLERIFWENLTVLAKDHGLKRSELINKIILENSGQPDNLASLLRCYVAYVSASTRSTAAARLHEAVRQSQQAPVPSFSIDSQKKLQHVNQDFVRLLRVISGSMNRNVSGDVVKLVLDTPLEQLFDRLLGTSDAVECGYSVQVDDRKRRGVSKVTVVSAMHEYALVGFIQN